MLMPTDIKYYQEFGGEKVVFEKEEIAEMKKFTDPGRGERAGGSQVCEQLEERGQGVARCMNS